MLSMILASTFAVPMVVTFVAFLLFSFIEQSEPITRLENLGQGWIANLHANKAIENLLEEIEINEIFEMLAQEGWQERAEEFRGAPIFNGGGYESEMPVEEFEELIWAVTLPDYAKLASDLLSRSKPQRGKGGRFVAKARPKPNQEPSQVESEPLAPIPAVFSFFKALYQPHINILIHITQQFNNT